MNETEDNIKPLSDDDGALMITTDLNVLEESLMWDTLIDEIIKGNVIPVIGEDMLLEDNKGINPHKRIIKQIAAYAQIYDTSPNSFSELRYHKNLLNKPYGTLHSYVNGQMAKLQFVPPKRLRDFLGTKRFPFVISTSFTTVVEQVMRDVWGEELKVLTFNIDPSTNNDIVDADDLRKPTVYYMFGKVGGQPHSYALTDRDMLDFVSFWIHSNNYFNITNTNLITQLKNKYLLLLGNNYNNWLFRFIWYVLHSPVNKEMSEWGRGLHAHDGSLDKSLVSFLERINTYTKEGTARVVDEILKRLNYEIEKYKESKFDRPEEGVDVFLSYSRTDVEIADEVYDLLSAHGKRVWYDKKNLSAGSRFKEEINRAIKKARFFVPIFTDNTEIEKDEEHYYRKEWDVAIDTAIGMGRTYIIPLFKDGFDFYRANIPDKLQVHNAIKFIDVDTLEESVLKIIQTMNRI